MSELVERGNSKYTDDQRREAAARYAVKGSLKAVAKEMNIPRTTLNGWKSSEWWDGIVMQARTEIEDEFRGKCHQIVEASTTAIMDRIKKGNEVNTKDGIKRLKVPAGELAKVGGIFYDKLRLSLNLPTSIKANTGHQKYLDDLANEFRRISRESRAITGEYTEIKEKEDDATAV